MLILKPVKPSITDCPARVPVTEEEIPAESNASAKFWNNALFIKLV